MSIDPNKIIAVFSDCRGTCKTPIGCTCHEASDKKEEQTELVAIEVEHEVIEAANLTLSETRVSILHKKYDAEARICGCGKSETGFCSCKAKNGTNGSVACCSGTNKLEVYNWLQNMPEVMNESKLVEVQFKNTRKEFYLNSNDIELSKGDVVAVESSPGHDIGEVTLTGKLVELQMKKVNYRSEIRRVYRIAKPNDLEKYEQSKAKEHKTMLRAREIAEELALDMKISDVEYQGDGNKAVFYYIADGRVDFRQLIKHYASEFRIKIEMKQIGARQEAGRVGGIGPCGRELCCSSSMSNFVSVSTQAARLQDIPLNPQKLAGQCGKLKCCLNFEVDTYVEAQKKLPARDTILETKDSAYFHFKTDILSGMMTYSTDKYFAANLITLPRERVFDIIRQNRKGDKPLTLIDHNIAVLEEAKSYDVLDQESITRFDESRNENRRNRRRSKDQQEGSQQRRGKKTIKKNEDGNDLVKAEQQAPKATEGQQQGEQRSANRKNRRNNRPRQDQNKQNNRSPRNEKKDDRKPEE